MFEPTMRLEAKIEKLENLLTKISQTGTISLESADELERLAPGAIRNLDPDFTFDVDESEHGVGIALEAGYDSLSKVKIAFIIAIVAFITRYLMKLTGKSKGISSGGGGGGGGGWGGKAAPTFETTKPATSIECHEEITNYEEDVDEDIKTLRKEFDDLLSKFDTEILSSNLVTGMTNNGRLIHLVNVIFPRILVNNGASKEVNSEGFNKLFSNADESVKIPSEAYSMYLPENIKDKGVVTKEQLGKIKSMLTIINQHYTPNKIFKTNPEIRKTGLMYFMIDEKLFQQGIEFIKFINKLISNIDQNEYVLRELDDAVTYRGQITNLLAYPEQNKKVWAWIGRHLNKSAEGTSPIRNFIEGLDKIIPPDGQADGVYYNTKTRATSAKNFVNTLLTGDSSDKDDDDYYKTTIEYLSGQSGTKELMKLLDKTLSDLGELSEEMASNKDNLDKFTSHVQKLAEGTVIYMNAGVELLPDKGEKGTPEITENKLTDANYKRMYVLVTELIQLYLTVIGAGAKMSVEIERLTTNRVKYVVGKYQEIANAYYNLNTTIRAIMTDANV